MDPDTLDEGIADVEFVEAAPSRRLGLVLVALLVMVGVWLITRPGGVEPIGQDESIPETTSPGPVSGSPVSGFTGIESPNANGYTLLGGADQTPRTLSLVRIPRRRGVAADSQIHSLVGGELVVTDASGGLSSVGQLEAFAQPGERREYVLATANGTVALSNGTAEFVPYVLDRPTVALGEGFSALPGPDQTSVWLLTSAERTARLVDLSLGTDRLAIDLADVGRPLDSVADGLVVTSGDSNDDARFWRPDGIETFAETAGTVYLGGGNRTVVFASGNELLVIDIDAPNGPHRRVVHSEPAVRRTRVSPDGRLLASSVVTPLTEPTPIVIIDLADGAEVHRVAVSIEVMFQWSSPTRLLYVRPSWPQMDIVERDVVSGIDANLVELEDLTWWYTAVEQPSDDGGGR